MNAINTWYRRNYNGILGVGAAVFGVLKAVVIILLTAASLGIAFTIFLSAKTLGLWWIPLEIGFIALLMFVALIPEHRRAMDALRYEIGDESFFELYPKEKEREEDIICGLTKWTHITQRLLISFEIMGLTAFIGCVWFFPIIVVYKYLKTIGVIAVIAIIFTYTVLLLSIPVYVRKRIYMRTIRGIMGDEKFFIMYPKEYRRHRILRGISKLIFRKNETAMLMPDTGKTYGKGRDLNDEED